jgi:hypothetical protein
MIPNDTFRAYSVDADETCFLIVQGDRCGFAFFKGNLLAMATPPTRIGMDCQLEEIKRFCGTDRYGDGRDSLNYLSMELLVRKVNGQPLPVRETGIERHWRELSEPVFPVDHVAHTNC